MKTKRMNLTVLRNEEHYQFQTELLELKALINFEKSPLQREFDLITHLHDDELEALQVIRKSVTSDQLKAANKIRVNTYNGLKKSVQSDILHFIADKQAAAKRLELLIKQCAIDSRKAYAGVTTSIVKLLTETSTTYAADVKLLQVEDWIKELDNKNEAFLELTKVRYHEAAEKTSLRMKEVRAQVDAAFRQLMAKIDALILINGDADYQAFVKEINVRIDKYTYIVALRKGKAEPSEEVPPVISERVN